MERIRRLEEAGIIRGYHALVDSRGIGLDVTAFIGVSTSPTGIDRLETELASFDEVLECHHVTGAYTMLLKAKTQNTHALERLISRLRLIEGVVRTETLIVLSTRLERTQVPLGLSADDAKPARRPANGAASKEAKVSAENESSAAPRSGVERSE